MDLETKSYIDTKLEKISQDIARELANLKASLYQNQFRTEAHLRGALVDGRISLDRQLEYLDGYQLFRTALRDIISEASLAGKIQKILEFNRDRSTDFTITLDDTDIIQFIENAGNTISEKLFKQLALLPMSRRTQATLAKVTVAKDKEAKVVEAPKGWATPKKKKK